MEMLPRVGMRRLPELIELVPNARPLDLLTPMCAGHVWRVALRQRPQAVHLCRLVGRSVDKRAIGLVSSVQDGPSWFTHTES